MAENHCKKLVCVGGGWLPGQGLLPPVRDPRLWALTTLMGLKAQMLSLLRLLVQESQRGYSPFSKMNCSPLKWACSYPTQLGAKRDQGEPPAGSLPPPRNPTRASGLPRQQSCPPSQTLGGLGWERKTHPRVHQPVVATPAPRPQPGQWPPCPRAPFPSTYGPECTTMELTFSIPASFKLGQGVFSSWQRPWKFSCSKRAIWKHEKRARQSLWGPGPRGEGILCLGAHPMEREQDGFCLWSHRSEGIFLPRSPRQGVAFLLLSVSPPTRSHLGMGPLTLEVACSCFEV